MEKAIIKWLLKGDVSIQYQVHRDLLKSSSQECGKLQARIETEGWGKRLLSLQKPDGHWGRGYYQPKWTSTHYSLLDLRNLHVPPDNKQVRKTLDMMFTEKKGKDGGINYARTVVDSDVCIQGMLLHIACYFKTDEQLLRSVVEYILRSQMNDGGWNCEFHHGAVHSSLHTTISVLEGILEYRMNGYTYEVSSLTEAEKQGQEFILCHQLYMSDKTGKTIDPRMLMLSYPSRWKYDILRGCEYFYYARYGPDERMLPALKVIQKKQRPDNTWPLQAKHPGQVHFDMEQTGRPSRWNTLRALKVLRYFGQTNL